MPSLRKGLFESGGCEVGGVGMGMVVGVAGSDPRAGRRAFPGTGLRTPSDSSPKFIIYYNKVIR